MGLRGAIGFSKPYCFSSVNKVDRDATGRAQRSEAFNLQSESLQQNDRQHHYISKLSINTTKTTK